VLTVLIIDEKSALNYEKFKPFFSPFIRVGEIKICLWNTEGTTVESALPDIYDIIKGVRLWRAIVVQTQATYTDESKAVTNPFDHFIESDREYADYESQATVRLSWMLTGLPDYYVDYLKNNLTEIDFDAVETRYDFKEIRPDLVYLVSSRALWNEDLLASIEEQWATRLEINSSDFWLRNKYSSKCRFLVYDYMFKHKELFQRDAFVFWMNVLVLSLSNFSNSSFQAYRLYRMSSVIDEKRLSEILGNYKARLIATQDYLADTLVQIQPHKVEDSEILNFTHPIHVRVYESDRDLNADHSYIGYAFDCPEDSKEVWSKECREVHYALSRFLRFPKRSIDESARFTRHQIELIDGSELELSKYQMDEMNESALSFESQMIDSLCPSMNEVRNVDNTIKLKKKEVDEHIDSRLKLKEILLYGLLSTTIYFSGFASFIIDNSENGIFSVFLSLLFATFAVLAVSSFGFISLQSSKRKVIVSIKSFNNAIKSIVDKVLDNSSKIERFLNNTYNLMRINKIINGNLSMQTLFKSQKQKIKVHLIKIGHELDNIGFLTMIFRISVNSERIVQTKSELVIDIHPIENTFYELVDTFEARDKKDRNLMSVFYPYDFIRNFRIERIELYSDSEVEGLNDEIN
jgi:hypothetical protein